MGESKSMGETRNASTVLDVGERRVAVPAP